MNQSRLFGDVITENNALQTPSWLVNSLGPFDLDPCAGPSTQHAQTNWTKSDDGFSKNWFGLVWCNPPFDEKDRWIKKVVKHNNGILLLPERGSAPWFGPLAKQAGRYFVMGKKVNFVGGKTSGNNVGTCLFPFGEVAESRIMKSGLPGHFVEVKFFNPRIK